MHPMFLSEVEHSNLGGAYSRLINDLRAAGDQVPQIMHLFAYKPGWTDFLSRFTQSVMRGPSPLPAGFRELIAAFTSQRNDCRF
jgi:alkylhydroperoxidase family enzyme